MSRNPDWLTQAMAEGRILTETVVRQAALVGDIHEVRGIEVKESEAAFQQRVIDLAHFHSWRVAHFRAVRIGRKDGSFYYATPVAADGEGFPDLILVRGTRCIAAELKAKRTDRPSARLAGEEQKAWLAAFRLTCVETYLWYSKNWPEIEEALK